MKIQERQDRKKGLGREYSDRRINNLYELLIDPGGRQKGLAWKT